MTHSLGPWQHNKYNGEDSIYSWDGIKIAIPEMWTEDEQGESEANARLIAAAPELLEACKEIVRRINENTGEEILALGQLQAAIAKAEGRQ